MEKNKVYDCAIVGGGLAGLCLAIQLADLKKSVILFEKNKYPFHKVCGEYISLESKNFLISLGFAFDSFNLPEISRLGISSEQGLLVNSQLDLGGFGVSRYLLDSELYRIALSKNVRVVEQCKVHAVVPGDTSFIKTSDGEFQATVVCGSYGKYVPMFVQQSSGFKKLNTKNSPNYIGVKYHIKADLPPDKIELHNFKDGYCGISRVEDGIYCLCYLSHADNLLQCGGDIKVMEEKVLYKNPHLKKIFTSYEFVDKKPLVISNVQFHKKQTSVDGVFLLGDAAGSITPLCGNGMSMAMRASKLLAHELQQYFDGSISKADVVNNYEKSWNQAFKSRIKAGYYLQHLFGKRILTYWSLILLCKIPALMKKVISMTHGSVFLLIISIPLLPDLK